jgi:penicillin-binding protein 2
VTATLDKLASLITLDPSRRERVLRDVGRNRKFVPVLVAENLSWEEFARVNLYNAELPGAQLDVGAARDYPIGPDGVHLLGYVAPVSPQDQGDDPLFQVPGFRIGRSGLEKQHDLALRGKSGSAQVEVNALGRVIRELERDGGQPGRDLVLTIDAGLQRFASQRLGFESAAAVVLDVATGDVLALTSSPAFDPNIFSVGVDSKAWEQLNADPYLPLTNKAVSGQYAPASTFKPIVALAALESGAIGANHQVHCNGKIQIGDHTFHCWKKEGHGTVDLVSGLAKSCDVFFYDVARRTGPDKIAGMARRFGLGEPTASGLPNEKPGLIPTRAWKQARFGKRWTEGETLVIGIGQGYVLTTPLQLALMTARLANGGLAIQPRLIPAGFEPGPPPTMNAAGAGPAFVPAIGINPAHLAIVLDGMKAVTRPGGTAYGARILEPEMAMAGKTGTGQVRRITQADRDATISPEQLPWEDRDHALFVGFAPAEAPRYAVAVVIEHGIGGSRAAAPVARDILREAQLRDSGRPPSGGALAQSMSHLP